MFIQVEDTPNPTTLKFIPGVTVMTDGTAEFKRGDNIDASPLAQKLFELDAVAAAFFGRDFVAVAKTDAMAWPVLRPMVIGAIMDHFVSGMPVIATAVAPRPRATPMADDDVSRQIIDILDTRVRPAVAADGGDIEFDRFEDGIVYLHMRGACAGCPSSSATLKNGIENMLKHFVPQVTEVRQVVN